MNTVALESRIDRAFARADEDQALAITLAMVADPVFTEKHIEPMMPGGCSKTTSPGGKHVRLMDWCATACDRKGVSPADELVGWLRIRVREWFRRVRDTEQGEALGTYLILTQGAERLTAIALAEHFAACQLAGTMKRPVADSQV